MEKKAFLVILDGWGQEENQEVSAIAQAKTPYMDSLLAKYPNAQLTTFGEDVGLPEGQMGNSEVGHLNIGAGRVVYQELARINKAIADKSFFTNPTLLKAIRYAKDNNKVVHLMGLVSDGGVHSHINHIKALCDLISQEGLIGFIHAFLDGRDTAPDAGLSYISDLMDHIDGKAVKISSIIGRYFAMDRDKRWERIQKAYDLLVYGHGLPAENALEAIQSSYNQGVTDEFMEPIKLGNIGEGIIKEDDVVIFFNFRTDRPRQLTEVLTQQAFPAFNMKPLDLAYYTMTEYSAEFKGIEVIYTKNQLTNTIGEVLAKAGKTQIRAAETEKYPHVTFFLNGGEEKVLAGEKRVMIKSPSVATYDLQPEMSAPELTDTLMEAIKTDTPDFICLNFANTDMVGHTGIMAAAIKAAETVDECLSKLIPLALENQYEILIIADHGNADIMVKEDGSAHTAHTTNPVPIIYVAENPMFKTIKSGKLADLAPSLLAILKVARPSEMTGNVLLG